MRLYKTFEPNENGKNQKPTETHILTPNYAKSLKLSNLILDVGMLMLCKFEACSLSWHENTKPWWFSVFIIFMGFKDSEQPSVIDHSIS